MSHHRETITALGAPEAAGPYSHAVRAGGLLFVSGQVHVDPETKQLVEGSAGEKARRCLENLSVVAAAAGASLADAVRIAVYVTDLSGFADITDAYAGYFVGTLERDLGASPHGGPPSSVMPYGRCDWPLPRRRRQAYSARSCRRPARTSR